MMRNYFYIVSLVLFYFLCSDAIIKYIAILIRTVKSGIIMSSASIVLIMCAAKRMSVMPVIRINFVRKIATDMNALVMKVQI